MKKILLITGLVSLVFAGSSQVVLNETYSNPGGTNSEFIELYNSSSSLVPQQMDCYTILTLWTTASTKGWYVMDLPASTVASKSWYVLAAASPFTVQGSGNKTPNFSWNAANFRDGSTGGYLKKYQLNAGGTGYNEINITGVPQLDVLAAADQMTGGQNRLTLLFRAGEFINGFWGGGSTGTLPVYVTGMPDLVVTPAGTCGGPFTIHFAQTPNPPPAGTTNVRAVEFVNSTAGADNGYYRLTDGQCGSWSKSAPGVSHTPGVSNGSAAGIPGELTTTVPFVACGVLVDGKYINQVQFNITGVTGSATLADDFPVKIQLYYDYTPDGMGGYLRQPNGILDGVDSTSPDLIKYENNWTDPAQRFDIKQGAYTILVYQTQRGCFDKVTPVANSCAPLPVDFKSFTATRNKANVMLKWVTASELNNDGFAVERNVNGAWEQVAYVNSQALSGNSIQDLSYQYIDYNNAKGISQYRIKQVDFDQKSKYTEVRSVKGDGQISKVVVYPNPTTDGKVNIVFDDVSVVRDITVIDMSGRTIKSIRGVSNNNITIDNLTPGVYSLRIFVPATGEQAVEKIVVSQR